MSTGRPVDDETIPSWPARWTGWSIEDSSPRCCPGGIRRRRSARILGSSSRAIQQSDPDSVIVGRAAARLSFWPDLPVDAVDVAVVRQRRPQPGYRFIRRTVSAEHVLEVRGVRLTTPSLMALDLVPALGGDAIDQVLRARARDLTALRQMLAQTA